MQKPVALGIDYSYRQPPETLAALRKTGVSIVARYYGEKSYRKCLNANEARELNAAGMRIVSVWETTAKRALKRAAAGTEDGKKAAAMAKACGQPESTPIFAACDFNYSTDAHYALVDAYLEAFGAELAGAGYRAGVYGEADVIDAFPELCGWQTAAWSHGRVSEHAQMLQDMNDWLVADTECDRDLVFDPSIAWTPVGCVEPPLRPVPAQYLGGDVVDKTLPVLRQGDSGDAVRLMQACLDACGNDLRFDGQFGPNTEAALKQFQRAHGVTVDGKCGPATWGALTAVVEDVRANAGPTRAEMWDELRTHAASLIRSLPVPSA